MKIIIITAAIILSIAALLAAVVYLRRAFYNAIDSRIERFQSELIEKQVREIQNLYKQVRGWRHDFRNHISNMKIQLSQGNIAELSDYLSALSDDLDTVDTVIKTGNVMADAILNSKLDIAKKQDICLNVKANIPAGIPMSDVELCSVLGNMLDNAIEACGALAVEERFMRVYIGKLKGGLYISVQNSAGAVRRVNGRYLSTKQGEHGYGIFRIDRIAKKYDGYINRQNEEGIFASELLIPLITEKTA